MANDGNFGYYVPSNFGPVSNSNPNYAGPPVAAPAPVYSAPIVNNYTPIPLLPTLNASGTPTNNYPVAGNTDAEKILADKQRLLNDLYAKIDAMDYSPEQKLILKQIAQDDSVSGGKVVTMEEVTKLVNDAAIKAEANIAPYHDKMTAREINDLKTNMESIRAESQRYGQQEAVDYTKQLNDTKQSLRVRGLTFGGVGRAQLGASGIIDSAGVAGTIPTERQATWEDKIAGWQGRANTLQTASQRALGLDEYGQIQGLPSTISTPADLLRPLNAPLTVNQTNPTDIGIGDLNAQRLKDLALAQTDIIRGYKPVI